MKTHSTSVLLLVFVALSSALPFIHRAYFVDDHYFVSIAKGILEHPTRPYDFRTDDETHQTLGWERGQPPRMVNPLLFHYYLAVVIRCWGDAVWKLRVSALIFSVMAVIAVYFLGFRFVARPLYPALLMALTPAYWLTSYSLLIDSAMVGFFLTALWTFMAGLEKRRMSLIVLSGMLMGATVLTKYSGILVIVLAVVWQVMHPVYRRWRPGYAAFGIFFALLFFWSFWNIQTYGAVHLLASAARGVKADEPAVFYLYKVLAVASFMGGGTLFILLTPFLLWRRSRLITAALLFFMAALTGLFMSRHGGFSFSQSIQLAIWISVSLGFTAALLLKGWSAEAPQRFLYVWFLAALAELVVVMPWTAGRYLLTLLPPLVWLFDQQLMDLKRSAWRWPILTLTAIGAFLIARADQAQANVVTDLARRLTMQDCATHGCYYLGDTFSAYPEYLGPQGWKAAFPDQRYQTGDLIVVAHYRQSSWWRLPDTLVRRRVRSIVYTSWLPVRVMDVPDSAGWYASCWGALPFVLTRDPLERYDVDQVL